MHISLFDFTLPNARIATSPARPRETARLLHIHKDTLSDKHIYDLPDMLTSNDVLVFNNSKVIPARLYGLRGEMKVEVLLHRKQTDDTWLAFARPTKRLKPEQIITFADDFHATVIAKREEGDIILKFSADGDAFSEKLKCYGEMPLPPYIARPDGANAADMDDYQTCYAQHEGSVAAPTAGLHYTPELLEKLHTKGIEMHWVTLHVGAGTFQPVKVEDTNDHHMHSEWGEVGSEVATALNAAKAAGKRIIPVGTTSLRVLESATDEDGIIHPFARDTTIFITPGYRFRLIDALMTNFHLPKSTLFMLTCALASTDTMQRAYAYAIKNNYRFYSYGDACLIEP